MGVPGLDRRVDAHHGLAAHEVVLLLDTDPAGGLAEAEARRRLERYGPNVLPQTRRAGPLARLLHQVNNPLVYVLLVAGAVTLALGEHVDAAVIFGVVLASTLVGYVQESRAGAALEALRAMVRTAVRVVRDGRARTVASDGLAPGDLVLAEAGGKVPAGLRLIREAGLRADESALTGDVPDRHTRQTPHPPDPRRGQAAPETVIISGR